MNNRDEKIAKAFQTFMSFKKESPDAFKTLDAAQHLYSESKKNTTTKGIMSLHQAAVLSLTSVFSIKDEIAEEMLYESERLGQHVGYTYFFNLFVGSCK